MIACSTADRITVVIPTKKSEGPRRITTILHFHGLTRAVSIVQQDKYLCSENIGQPLEELGERGEGVTRLVRILSDVCHSDDVE